MPYKYSHNSQHNTRNIYMVDRRQSVSDNNGNPLERLSYPRDIGNSGHFMLFLPIKYVYSGGYQGFVEVKRDSASIVLPLPKNLSDSYSVNWEKEDVGGAVDKLASGNISNGVSGDDITQVVLGALSKYGSDSVVNALISKFGLDPMPPLRLQPQSRPLLKKG
jgi:hypothetical protein